MRQSLTKELIRDAILSSHREAETIYYPQALPPWPSFLLPPKSRSPKSCRHPNHAHPNLAATQITLTGPFGNYGKTWASKLKQDTRSPSTQFSPVGQGRVGNKQGRMQVLHGNNVCWEQATTAFLDTTDFPGKPFLGVLTASTIIP